SVMSMDTPRSAPVSSAASTAAFQRSPPHGNFSISRLSSGKPWCTSAISTPLKPASAISLTSRTISSISTSPFGHHHRNFGATASAGFLKKDRPEGASPPFSGGSRVPAEAARRPQKVVRDFRRQYEKAGVNSRRSGG